MIRKLMNKVFSVLYHTRGINHYFLADSFEEATKLSIEHKEYKGELIGGVCYVCMLEN